MEQEKKIAEKSFMNDDEPGFDIMEWVNLFLGYWYLFAIGLVIALGLSLMQNRKWLPVYKTSGTVIIDESRSSLNSAQVMMQGFGVGESYRNVNNQVIMINSYDLLSRVVDSLQHMQVEYISRGRFRTRNLYDQSPVYIHKDFVSPAAIGVLFKLKISADGTFQISEEDDALPKDFLIKGRLGVPLQHNLFFITLHAYPERVGSSEIYFRFRTRDDLIGDFSSRLRLNYVMEGSSVLEISLASETPARDVDFINKLCEVYLMSNLERKNDAASRTITFIDEQLSNVSLLLEKSQDNLTDFRKRNQMIDVTAVSGEILAKAASYDAEMNQIRLQESYLDYLTKYLRTNLNDGTVIAPSSLGLTEPMLMTLVQQINDLLIKRSEITEKNLFYAKYTRDIDNLRIAVDEVVKNMRSGISIQKQDLKIRQAELQVQLNQLPEKELEMVGIERDYRMNDSYYTLFLQKKAEAQILKASNTPDNNILDKARTLAVTNGGERSRTTMIFLVLGLLIPAALIIVKELLNNTIQTNKDVEKFCVFPLIGTVRHTNSESPYIVANNPRSSFTEMFRIIRTRIEFLARRKTEITIMVTSSESGDGKTYFSINLASIYSMASQKTLLIDMDIRKPSVYRRLNCENDMGLSNYLANQCELDNIIVRPEGAEFDFITAGTVPPNAGELIRSDKLAEMMKVLRQRYDYIIVDTSPIGIVADSYSFASLSDINLFVVRSNKTNKMFVRNLSSQLRADNIKNFYAVLNDVDTSSASYSSYYTKRYAYGYNNRYRYGGYGNYSYGYGYGYGYGSPASSKKKKKNGSDNYFQYYQDDTKDI
jgi:capsular exopolysaccharide synthesis family protein